MNKIKLLGFLILIVLPVSVLTQQVSPIPEFEKQIRNGTSLKMRSAELERIKRESNKVTKDESVSERKFRFAAIKKDFESIQKLQLSIIKAYTKGKQINYKKIAKNAESMTVKARRLDGNMFGENNSGSSENKSDEYNDQRKMSVRDLIIKLDKTIGNFVTHPIFKDLKTVDTKASKTAQIELKKITLLSQTLFRKAEESK